MILLATMISQPFVVLSTTGLLQKLLAAGDISEQDWLIDIINALRQRPFGITEHQFTDRHLGLRAHITTKIQEWHKYS